MFIFLNPDYTKKLTTQQEYNINKIYYYKQKQKKKEKAYVFIVQHVEEYGKVIFKSISVVITIHINMQRMRV